jgi:nicotinate phosphoribosyltransferase
MTRPDGRFGALFTDLYELTMVDSYLRRDMSEPATFSLYVRALPHDRGFLVAAGVEDCLDALQQLAFQPDELEYIASLLGADAAQRFAGLCFNGDVVAVAEGSVMLADEPLLEVTAALPEAQLVETLLLNLVTYQTAIATTAARCRIAARDIELVDFASRRTHGMEAALAVARVTAMVGFAATSNVEAARRYGLHVTGTMAHSYVEAFASETLAFRAFAQDFPERATFLVDTYDTLEGVRNAIRVIQDLALRDPVGVRIDSGDLVEQSRAVRSLLDEAGLTRVKIVVSGGLDEYALERLAESGAPVDVAGVGTRVGVSADAPALDSVYKLVAYAGRPVLKVSEGKATLPAPKQVYRGEAIDADLLALRDEARPSGSRPLLEEALHSGVRLRPRPLLAESREVFERDLALLPAGAQKLRGAATPQPALSPRLGAMSAELATRARPVRRRGSG